MIKMSNEIDETINQLKKENVKIDEYIKSTPTQVESNHTVHMPNHGNPITQAIGKMKKQGWNPQLNLIPKGITSLKNHPTIDPNLEGLGITEFIINVNKKSPRMHQWIMRGFFYNALPHINQATIREMGDELQSLLFGNRVKKREDQKTDAILLMLEEADRLFASGKKKEAKGYMKAVELVVEDLKDSSRYIEIKEALEEMYDRLQRKTK